MKNKDPFSLFFFTSFLISTFISDDEKKSALQREKVSCVLEKISKFLPSLFSLWNTFLALTFEVELGKELFSIFKQQKTMVFRNNLSILKSTFC